MQQKWLEQHLKGLSIEESHEGYLLGRGAQESKLSQMLVRTWLPLEEESPDPLFRERFGVRGERLEQWVVWAMRSPTGEVLGIEARRIPEKKVLRYLLPESRWQSIWLGLDYKATQRIHEGCDVWIVEGLFDMFALQWVVPEQDVVLASLRASLTWKQVEFLSRFCTGWVHMVYDNDEAGRFGVYGDEQKKVWGALQKLERVGVRVGVTSYKGKDPGEIWDLQGLAGLQQQFNGMG